MWHRQAGGGAGHLHGGGRLPVACADHSMREREGWADAGVHVGVVMVCSATQVGILPWMLQMLLCRCVAQRCLVPKTVACSACSIAAFDFVLGAIRRGAAWCQKAGSGIARRP